MGLGSWVDRVRRTSRRTHRTQVDLVSKVSPEIKLPETAGLEQCSIPQPWSVARVAELFSSAEISPSVSSIQAARIARYRLSCFWLAAPVDQLQALYGGEIGQLQHLMLSGSLSTLTLARDEQKWIGRLKQLMVDAKDHPQKLCIGLALVAYGRSAELNLEEMTDGLPDWFVEDYWRYCNPDLEGHSKQPVGLLQAADKQPAASQDIAPFADRRGEEAMAWFRDDDTLNQMRALLQAYQANPESDEVVVELAGLRLVMAQLWLDVDPTQLHTLFQTSVGEITVALIQAGFGKSILNSQDRQLRDVFAAKTKDLAHPKAPAYVLSTLMFYPPERIGFKSTDGLPQWFADVMPNLCGSL